VILIAAVCITEGPQGLLLDHPLAYVYLGLGGVVGLSICDSLLFRSYALIGPRIAFLIFATSPFFAAIIAWPVLDERIGWMGVLGMAVTVGGILLVTLGGATGGTMERPPRLGTGIVLAGLAAVGMGVTGVLAKLAFRLVEIDLSVHTFRMAMGALGLLVGGALFRSLGRWARGFREPRISGAAVLGTCLGPVFGVWFYLVSVRHTDSIGIAATLSSMTPVFVIPFTWVFHGDRPTIRSVLGAIIAVAGVALLFARDAALR
jgi:drug/metabolite transporter (DMT)-like permease